MSYIKNIEINKNKNFYLWIKDSKINKKFTLKMFILNFVVAAVVEQFIKFTGTSLFIKVQKRI